MLKQNHFHKDALDFVSEVQQSLRASEVLEAKAAALAMYVRFTQGVYDPLNRQSRALILYYIVKVIKKFEDYHFLTHQIY